MAKKFRLACSFESYLTSSDKTKRPEPPRWIQLGPTLTRAGMISHRYWTKIYWATPPWIDKNYIEDMKQIYASAGQNEVDHVVPLSSPIVCGLHVPWNLQHLPPKTNGIKSNHMWPGHPCENNDLFEEFEPQQMMLI